MEFISNNKFFNRYLPMFLSVLLIVAAVFAYQIFEKPQVAKAGFSFFRSITVNSGQVPSTQTAFPMLVSGTYSYLATAGNGGKVQNSSGYDVGFYASSDCSTGKMAWETELYTAGNGKVVYWVKVPSIQNGSVIYMCYGDATISSDQSNASGVWDSNYKGVYHLADGTTLSAGDSTGNFNGTNAAAAATAGQIDGAADFNGSAQITTANTSNYGDFTACAWFKTTTNSAGQRIVDKLYTTGFWMGENATGGFDSWGGGIEQPISPNGIYVTLAHGSWHMLCNERSGSLQTITGDGTVIATTTVVSTALDSNPIYIGAVSCCSSLANAFTGQIDQVEISNIARSADWIATEYNNQNSPGAFYTVSSETVSTPPKTGNFIQVGGKFRLVGGKIIIK